MLIVGISTVRADPIWVPPKGTFHTALSYTHAQWDQYLQMDGASVNLPGEVIQYEFTAFAEYVPIENLSFDITFPLIFSQKKFVHLLTDFSGQILDVTLGPGGEVRDINTNVGIGDVTLGIKYIFWDQGASIGVRPYVKVPGTYQVGELANAPGDGQTDLGLSLLAGVHIPSIYSYLRGSLSLVYRSSEPANQLEFMIEPGVNFTPKLSLRVLYQYIEQLGGDEFTFFNTLNFYPANEEDVHRIGAGLTYRASDLIGFFGLYQQTIAGRNTANTKAITFGVDFAL